MRCSIPPTHAALLDAHAWSLYNIDRLARGGGARREAVRSGERARRTGPLGRGADRRCPVSNGRCAARRTRWPAPGARVGCSTRGGATPAARPRGLHLGACWCWSTGSEESLPLDAAARWPADSARRELAALARNYRGSALLQLGDLDGRAELLDGVARPRASWGTTSTSCAATTTSREGLWRLGRYAEAARYLDEAADTPATATSRPTSYFVGRAG